MHVRQVLSWNWELIFTEWAQRTSPLRHDFGYWVLIGGQVLRPARINVVLLFNVRHGSHYRMPPALSHLS